MLQTANLQVTGINNFSQPFGKGYYAIFTCLTEDGSEITAAVNHNALARVNVSIDLLDLFVGSTIVALDNTDLDTKEITSGFDRVQGIVDGTTISPKSGEPQTIILFNSLNCRLDKGVEYKAQTMSMVVDVKAAVQIADSKQKAIDQAAKTKLANIEKLRVLAEKKKLDTLKALAAKANGLVESTTDDDIVEDNNVVEDDVVLETNETELPF